MVDTIRIPHWGNIQGEVIDGAFRVLDEFEAVEQHTEAMKALQLQPPEEIAFATAALALRFGESAVAETGGHCPAPVTAEQLTEARRPEDIGHNLVWPCGCSGRGDAHAQGVTPAVQSTASRRRLSLFPTSDRPRS